MGTWDYFKIIRTEVPDNNTYIIFSFISIQVTASLLIRKYQSIPKILAS